jgi:hypothetical protein
VGDAACIASAALFGVHKWRSEGATSRFADVTNELIALQLAALAAAAALVSAPDLARLLARGPGGALHPQNQASPSDLCMDTVC